MTELLFGSPQPVVQQVAPTPPKVTDPSVEAARRGEIKAAQQSKGRAATAFGGLKTSPILGESGSIGRKALLGS